MSRLSVFKTPRRVNLTCDERSLQLLDELAETRRQPRGGVVSDLVDAEAKRLGLIVSPAVGPRLSAAGDTWDAEPDWQSEAFYRKNPECRP